MVSLMNTSTTTMFIPQRRRTMIMSANLRNTELLRTQLHQLHSEAEKTRDKASNTRLRLMRLSEAAMKLQQQAATDVRIGRENEARELLVQKRKVMQALEKSKSRIEMLDELLAKLNEAISAKETQLVGNVSSGLEFGRDNTSSNVRIISPKEDNFDLLNEEKNIERVISNHAEDHDLQSFEEYRLDNPINQQKEEIEEASTRMVIKNEPELVNSLKDVSSYEEFLKNLDDQLYPVEEELTRFLRFSSLVLESEDRPKNSKVQQAHEILENVQRIRKRIASITRTQAGII
ncbi:forkhead-associated domain protein [Thalictrum thalictroides]|uniref:Forkhead-associated domain protein n=1 Tax=Thalictrum thalictroides TaxID=46969 RepID=A0A7J6WX79_THATH|nr:forkhead-associated domain protein [Thalictrum thalictroides]